MNFYKLLTVTGLLLGASACTINPLKKYAGIFCNNIYNNEECFYFYEDGTGLVDDGNISLRIEWELIGENKVFWTAYGTPKGSVVTFSEDRSEFVGRGSFFQFQIPLTYEKQDNAAPKEENKALKALSCAVKRANSFLAKFTPKPPCKLTNESDCRKILYAEFINKVKSSDIKSIQIAADVGYALAVDAKGSQLEVGLEPDRELLGLLTNNKVDVSVIPAEIEQPKEDDVCS